MVGLTFQDKFVLNKNYKVVGDCWEWVKGKDRNGYGKTTTCAGSIYYRVPMLSYELHYGIKVKGTGKWVLHHCDNPSCLRPDHLYLGTAKDNGKDKKDRGRAAKGEKQASCLLTEKEVKEIRKLYEEGGRTYIGLGFLYDVSPSTISKIINRVTWDWIM